MLNGLTVFLAAIKNSIQSPLCNVQLSGQLRDIHKFTAIRNLNAVALVVSLFPVRCPSTVAWLVVSVWINSINGVRIARAKSHVSHEVLERIQPSLTNSNAPPAISRIARVFGFVASNANISPAGVLWSFAETMLGFCSSVKVISKASAAFRFAATKCRSVDNRSIAAFAYTVPLSVTSCDVRKLSNSPAVESLASEVFEGVVRWDRMSLSHDVFLQNRNAIGQSRPALVALRSGSLHSTPSREIFVGVSA